MSCRKETAWDTAHRMWIEAQRGSSWGWSSGPPPHQLRGLGERFKLPAGSNILIYLFTQKSRQNRQVSLSVAAYKYHGLCGSASQVFTATGLVNGTWRFSTPYRIAKMSQVITSATPTAVPNLVHIRPRGASGRIGKIWLKFYLFILFMPLFSGTHLQVRCVGGFSRMMAQTTRTRARCAFLGSWHCSPFRGKIPPPKKNNFGAWIGIFKPNPWNRKTTCILSKLLHRFQPNFAHR